MGSIPVLAQETGYVLAGILTVIAAALVTVVILLSSRSDSDETR